MEDFSLAEYNVDPVDVVICNNVLDHVRSVEGCFEHIHSSLKDGGILIFGQDLTSEEDADKHEKINDPCHPIKIDECTLQKYIHLYDPIYERVLPRLEGRKS